IHHTGFGALTSCQIQDCGQGLYLSGASERGDITLENVTIQGSQADGLVAIRCTGNATGGDGGFSQGGEYGAYLYDSALTLSDAAVSGAEYGISAFQSELDLQQATVEDCTIDGLFLDQTSASVTDSAIRGCRYGIRSENNGTLQVSGCELTGHRDWAIHHAGYGSVADSTVSGNERGLYLVGATTRGDVTLSNTGVEDMDQEGLSLTRCIADVPAGTNWLSSGGDYGIYLNDSQLIIATPQIRQAQLGFQCQDSTLQASNAVIDHCTQDAVSAAGSQLEFSGCQVSHCRQGFALTDSSSLTLSQATLSDLALDGVSSDGSSVTITASAIVRARSGLRGVNASTLHASATTVDDTTAWGIYHTGYGTLTGCTLTGCGQGLYLLGATQSSDVQFSEMRIQNTAGEGLVAMQCMGTISGSGARLSQGGAYGAYCSHATVTFDDVSIISAQYGVIADQSTLTLQDSDISSTTAGGILATSSTLNLSNTTVTDCGTRGVDCQSSSTVTATGCRIERCADWGLVLAGTGTLTDCVIHDNQHGAYLTGAAQRGDIQLVRLTLGESAGQGLVAIRCDGDITGDNGFSGGGEWGLYANDSRLTLAGATLTSNTYGVYSTLSNVTLSGCHVQDAAHGVYSSADQNVSLTRSRIDGSTVWGLQSLQGNLQLVNCVLANNANGLHLANTLMANVWNVTVVGNMTYGVHQEGGLVQLRNTIVAGGGEHGTGLHCTGGSLLTAHNLVYGFATPFVGVTPDADTLVKNPRFVDQDGGDYRLAKGSPAINTGVDLVGTVDQDYLGQSRPAFRRWEIGAYEYLADDGSLRILQWTEQR
ncbi:MAG: right-handed parallel beta-helix repeat-containing protein, partial [Pirellulaceae bacterium]